MEHDTVGAQVMRQSLTDREIGKRKEQQCQLSNYKKMA